MRYPLVYATMPRAQHSVQIDAPIEAVVLLVGAFDLFADFHPQVASCEVEGEGPGAMRTLWLADGQVVHERLVEDLSNGYVYEGTAASSNMAGWRGRIEVHPARGEYATVTWTLDVDPARGVDIAVLMARSQGMLEEGLGSAKRQLEGLD